MGLTWGSGASAAWADQGQEEAATVQRLVDRDPAVRETARRALLGLRVEDLSGLAEALRQVPAPVLAAPSVEQTLREAVIHVHVRQAKEQLIRMEQAAAVPFGGDPRSGLAEAFMGFQLRPTRMASAGFPEVPEGEAGVPVAVVIAGFVAYERLEEGDVLIAIRDRRDEERVQPVLGFMQLQSVLQQYRPGQEVDLLVLRGGEVVSVPLVLDRRPEGLNSREWPKMEQQARQRAAQLWAQQFAPAFDAPADTTASVE